MPSPLADGVRALADLPGVRDEIEKARAACTELRWHQALRRRIPEAAAESRVRGAWASGELDGARLSVDIVRDLMRGATTWHENPDPVEVVMQGVIAATAESEHVRGLVRSAPLQALARLHVAAAAGLVDAEALGRPRVEGEDCREFLELSPAPEAEEARARLMALADLLLVADELPIPLVVAIVHAEIITARPFVRGNGVVARAMERAIVQACGLDPTGVAVTEAGHGAQGGPAYFGALTAYQHGDAAGVGLWIVHSCKAIQAAAEEGTRIADAVLAGRLT